MMNRLLEKILARIGRPDLVEILAGELSLGELTTLLLEVFRKRSREIAPHQLLRAYRENRFVHPGNVDPELLREMENFLFRNARERGFLPRELSPVTPLGTVSGYGKIDQNNVLTALRGTELVADPANVLALHLAEEFRAGLGPLLHGCASQRVIRAQSFSGPLQYPHFTLFACVSLLCLDDADEFQALVRQHLDFQREICHRLGLRALRFVFSVQGADAAGAEVLRRQLDGYPDLKIAEDSGEDCTYYQGFRISLDLLSRGAWVNVGDMGPVSWAAELLEQARLRLLTSGLGVDRLIQVAENARIDAGKSSRPQSVAGMNTDR